MNNDKWSAFLRANRLAVVDLDHPIINAGLNMWRAYEYYLELDEEDADE